MKIGKRPLHGRGLASFNRDCNTPGNSPPAEAIEKRELWFQRVDNWVPSEGIRHVRVGGIL